jgi:ribonuclease BN (tRNA processing enzyme)
MFGRREMIIGTVGGLGAALLARPGHPQSAAAEKAVARVQEILLGTKGGPALNPVKSSLRFPTAHVLLVGDVPYIIDCGLGVTGRLVESGLPLRQLRHIFITHHHSDHNLEYGNLFYTAWASGLATPVDAWGPPPLTAITQGFFELNRYDIELRIPDEGRPDPRPLLRPHEFTAPGLVFRNDDVKVTAALRHHPPVAPTFAFRFDMAGRSVVFSGDGSDSENLIGLAEGADVLICEAMYLPGIERLAARFGPRASRLLDHLRAAHTTTEQVGQIAAAAGVKTLVLSHLVPGDDPAITDEMWIAGARRHYPGKIVVAKDLMVL